MKYDKYGDPIPDGSEQIGTKKKKALWIMIGLQSVLIIFNILVLLIDFLNLYLCFMTAPLFIFFYIAYQKGCSAIKETSQLPAFCKVATWALPLVYVLTAVLAIFSGI